MRDQTNAFIERPYEQIVDDILTAMLGGVTNEPILYDEKTAGYKLSRDARLIRSITGKVQSNDPDSPQKVDYRSFIQGSDFEFDAGRNEVAWSKGGIHPKDDTLFYVDYLLPEKDTRSPLTDINVGSVTRTISESIGREIATLYQQMRLVYESGFIDTATGKSLDFVVAILGIERRTKDFAEGLITFFRDPTSDGNISIPEGTQVTTEKGEVIFETTQPRTLQRGQVRINVPARATTSGEIGNQQPNSLIKLFQEVEGISNVTNFEETMLGTRDETDDELRIRARAALRALGKGTIIALQNAVIENRGKILEVWDSNGAPNRRSELGQVKMLIESEPERFVTIRQEINQVRAAGIRVTLEAKYVYMTPRLIVKITKELPAEGKRKIIDEVIAALQGYVDGLSGNAPAVGSEMLEAIQDVTGVTKATFVDVLTAKNDNTIPEEDVVAQNIIDATSEITNNEEKKERIKEILTANNSFVPGGARTPERGLVQGIGDNAAKPATDKEIEAGEFEVAPGAGWFITLDMDETDIVLVEE